MNIRNLILVIATILVLASCETRKDIFHQFNSAAEVYLSSKPRDFSQKLKSISLTLRHGEQRTIYFDYEDDYKSSGIKMEYAIFFEGQNIDYIKCIFDTDARKIVIEDTLPKNTLNEKISKFSVKIYVYDYYGDRGEAEIKVVDYSNVPPIPAIEVTQISGMEYTISAQKSVDGDGDDVVSFEYLIDGEPTIIKAGYENSDDKYDLINPGMAGKKGTYIISTPLSSVKHAFQSTGTHNIYVRVKDALGLWCKWEAMSIEL